MTGKRYCERHFATYAASGPCPDCEAMSIEARAKAAAPKATHEVTTPWMRVDKPLLAMVPKQVTRTGSGEWKVDLDKPCQTAFERRLERGLEAAHRSAEERERLAGKVLGMLMRSGSGEYVGWLCRGRDAKRDAIRTLNNLPDRVAGSIQWHGDKATAPGSGTLIVAADETELRGYRFVDGVNLPPIYTVDFKRREYSFPSKPVAPSGLAAWLPEGADVEADAARLAGVAVSPPRSLEAVFRREADIIERAKRETDAALARLRDSMYRGPPPGTGKTWAEVLSEWAPSTKTRESFFGTGWANEPAEPRWYVQSNPSDGEAAKQFADKVRAARWWETLPKLEMTPPPVIEDPECPPGKAFLMKPLRPDEYTVTAKFCAAPAFPASPLKIMLPEDG